MEDAALHILIAGDDPTPRHAARRARAGLIEARHCMKQRYPEFALDDDGSEL